MQEAIFICYLLVAAITNVKGSGETSFKGQGFIGIEEVANPKDVEYWILPYPGSENGSSPVPVAKEVMGNIVQHTTAHKRPRIVRTKRFIDKGYEDVQFSIWWKNAPCPQTELGLCDLNKQDLVRTFESKMNYNVACKQLVKKGVDHKTRPVACVLSKTNLRPSNPKVDYPGM